MKYKIITINRESLTHCVDKLSSFYLREWSWYVESVALTVLGRQQCLLPSSYTPAIMWACKKREGKKPFSYRFCLQHSNCSLIGRHLAPSRPLIGCSGSVETVESDRDRGEERSDWLRLNWKRKALFLKACETVDGVCILGVTPKVIRPAPSPSQDLFKLRTIKQSDYEFKRARCTTEVWRQGTREGGD